MKNYLFLDLKAAKAATNANIAANVDGSGT